jgi:mediator of RNA polymerase II transcription subunit 12
LREILDETELPLDDYANRNKALLFSPRFTNDTSSPRRLQMQEIQKLDSMSSGTSMSDLCKSFFDGSASPTSIALDLDRFQDKVYILLGWAMSLFTLGVHRPYAICTLLKLWHDERTSYLAKGKGQSNIDVFPALYNWLDTSAPARNPSNVLAIGITFGELTRSGMFSYSRYIRTLIAQGKTARCAPEQMRSHHLGILRALPIFVEGKDLMYQRRIALSGDDWETRDRDESEEQRQMEAFREEVQEYVPEIFGYKRWRRSASLRDSIDHQLTTPPFLNRYMFLQARFWLFTLCADHLRPQAKVPAMDASTFARLLQLFRQCYGLSTTADLMLRAIKEAENTDVVLMAMDTVVREADCWTANDRWSRIVDVLMDRLLHSSPTEMLHRRIANLLSELDTQGRLTKTEKKELRGAKEQIEKVSTVSEPCADDSLLSSNLANMTLALVCR